LALAKGFWQKALSYKKCARKMLMKLTTGCASLLYYIIFFRAKFDAMLFALCKNEDGKASMRVFLEVKSNTIF